MKKVLFSFLFSFHLYAEVTPFVSVKYMLGLPYIEEESVNMKEDFRTSFALGLAGGVMVPVNEAFGLKVDLGLDHRASMVLKKYPGDYMNLDTMMVNGNAVFNVGPVSPYVGFGGGFTMSLSDNDSSPEFSYQVGTGVEYKVTEKFGAALGYRYVQFANDDDDASSIYSHDVVLTTSYYF